MGESMTVERYFSDRDTPSRNSPVGSLLVRILAESPELSFEDARQLTHSQLLKAGARRNYRITTPLQDKERAERFRKRVNATREIARTPILASVPTPPKLRGEAEQAS